MPAPPSQTLTAFLTAAVGHFQAGRLAEAEATFRDALALSPDHAGATFNLAVTLRALGRVDEAAAQYRRAIVLKPDNAKAHNNLGVILAMLEKNDDAAAQYLQALQIQPDYPNAHYNFANLLKAQRAFARAIDHYRQALVGNPDDAETHNNLGAALAADGQGEAAIQHYQQALALRRDYAEAFSNLGSALADLGRTDEAMGWYAKALAFKPAFADARFNLGQALDMQDRTDEALAQYELALALDPMHAEAHNNFGFLSQRLGRVDEALARYERAQTLKPDYADAHWNESLARLLVGDFETGWRKYEWRWRRKDSPPRVLPAPLWDGDDLTGRTILLHTEQGLGDAIQFIRYAPLVKAKGGVVVFECLRTQHRLFNRVAGIDRLIPAGEPFPPFDCHAPLLSLPTLLDTRLETIPAAVPYLKADAGLAGTLGERLAGLKRPKVGLVWRGNPGHPNDKRRSMPAATVAALVRGASGVDWLSLQIDARPDELADFAPVVPYQAGPHIGDWADTAAVVQDLDLVVTVDTSMAHLAGALGKPVWVMLPFAPDWRWLLDRADSPWYPTMRLFRQPAPGDWRPGLDEVRAALDDIGAPTPLAAPAVNTKPRRLPPAMVVSHERSGTHFLMNALSYGYGYTAEPWIDLDGHTIAIDYSNPARIAEALEVQAADHLMRIVKSHHSAEQFAGELERITRDYRIFYIYREPAAVMVSLWRHLNGLAWDEGPKVADPLTLAKIRPGGAMTRYQAQSHPTLLHRWAAHVEGWLAAAQGNPRIVPVRYEDLDGRYDRTVAAFADVVGRAPLTPLLRPPGDVNVIAMGRTLAETPVVPATLSALTACCRAEVGGLLTRLGY
jgi:tetratricopeptide (TPR) repeat protein